METIEALIHRRSCRNYSDRPVEAEKLARIIEAGQYAPSGMGRQPVTFVAVTDPATVERLSQLNAQVMGSNGDPFYGAKTVVVVLVDRSVPTHLEDGSLAMATCSMLPMRWVLIRAGFIAPTRFSIRPRAWSCWPAGACPPTEACAVLATAFWATPRTHSPRPSLAATTWCMFRRSNERRTR